MPPSAFNGSQDDTHLMLPFLPLASMVEHLLSQFTYFAVVGLLTLAGMGVPIPEDIPLITSGYMCHPTESPIAKANQRDFDRDGLREHLERGVPYLHMMIFSGILGVLIGDTIVFAIGRQGIHANNMFARRLQKVVDSKRREKVESYFARYGNLTVFCGRFMPGFRSIVFAFAGMSKMSYVHFMIIDGIAALISVPVFVYLGYHFAARMNELFDFLHEIRYFAVPIISIIALCGLLAYLRRRRLQPIMEQA
jgi:membrane protein DedA with SNARE-associated domain